MVLICTKITTECPITYTIYGYRLNPFANGFFAIFFALCFFAHIGLGIRFRTKSYTIALTLGCLSLTLGYISRLGLYFSPFDTIYFQVQVCFLIIAPAFNSAAIYLMLKHIVGLFGSQWSVLKPKQYTVVFITADVISLILQATGGGIAATTPSDNTDQLDLGNNIMMAGIAFQVVTLSIFAILASVFVVRRVRACRSYPLSGSTLETWQSTNFRCFIFGVTTAFVVIFIRCIYRIAEMNGGWGNPLMKEQVPFIILEGVMMLIATLCQTILHPGHFFPAMTDSRVKSDNSSGTWTEVAELPILSK